MVSIFMFAVLLAGGAGELTPEMRGDIFMARKMYREAIDMYRQIPESYVTANKIGIAYHQMTMLDQAKRQYDRSVKLNPKYAEALNNIGTVYYAKKSYRRAVSQYNKALKIAPNSASILSNLGTAYFARKKYKEAFEIYQQALALDADVFEHRSTQGVLLQERSVEERAKFHFYLAKTYAKAGVADRALLYMRKAIEEGFRERDKFKEDPEFASLREMPEFKELLLLEPRVL
ncbi:MAG: tetratricopeptide repeat protein [Acidobacteria bacterium]|nr:tetratricopeptide repeat protein [Acidobacteriota bacterium]